MYKVIFLDIDDTLLNFEICSRQALQKAFKRLGEEYAKETYPCFQRIDNMLWTKQKQGELTIDEVLNQRFCLIAEELGLKSSGEVLSEQFIYWLYFGTEKEPGTDEILEYLASKYKLFGASNGILDMQLHRMRLAGLRRFFYDVFVSDDIGYEKPDRLFFEEILRRAGVAPGEALMIGDSLSADIFGAAAAGIDTIWYNPKGKPGESGKVEAGEPKHVITDLRELKYLL